MYFTKLYHLYIFLEYICLNYIIYNLWSSSPSSWWCMGGLVVMEMVVIKLDRQFSTPTQPTSRSIQSNSIGSDSKKNSFWTTIILLSSATYHSHIHNCNISDWQFYANTTKLKKIFLDAQASLAPTHVRFPSVRPSVRPIPSIPSHP